jgi:hypothetical protein
MNAIVLPELDKSTVDELKKRIPNLAEIDLPNLKKLDLPKLESVGKNAGKTADDTIDRLLGRSRAPVWPWVAMGIGLVAVIGGIAAYMTWWRRPAWKSTSEPWAATSPDSTTGETPSEPKSDIGGSTGLTAAESSLTSTPYGTEDA